jgi:hypothetical protein
LRSTISPPLSWGDVLHPDGAGLVAAVARQHQAIDPADAVHGEDGGLASRMIASRGWHDMMVVRPSDGIVTVEQHGQRQTRRSSGVRISSLMSSATSQSGTSGRSGAMLAQTGDRNCRWFAAASAASDAVRCSPTINSPSPSIPFALCSIAGARIDGSGRCKKSKAAI